MSFPRTSVTSHLSHASSPSAERASTGQLLERTMRKLRSSKKKPGGDKEGELEAGFNVTKADATDIDRPRKKFQKEKVELCCGFGC